MLKKKKKAKVIKLLYWRKGKPTDQSNRIDLHVVASQNNHPDPALTLIPCENIHVT